MRIIKCGLAAMASLALALAVLPAGSAQAAPRPRNEEWWFSAWALQNKVWPQSTGRGVTVALVDTGVNASLPELRGAVIPGADVRDQGQGGDGRQDLDKESGGHGTGMAALIAGQGGPARMVGVAPDAKIMPIVTDAFSVTDAKAIRYAVSHGAKVISISLGSPDVPGQKCGSDLQQAIADAVQKNVVIVASAGNNGNAENMPQFPASCAGVLAVGAVDSHLRAWPLTQRQSYVSAAAPGWGVGSINKQGRFLNNISGTSQAAALTAGAAAILRARYPNLSARDLVQRLINTTVDAGPKGQDQQTGSGAVVPILALTRTVEKSAPNPPFQALDQWLAANKQSAGPTASGPAAKDSGSSSSPYRGLGWVFVGLLIVVAVVVFLLVRRRGRRTPAAAGPPPHPNQPWQQPPPPGQAPQNQPWQSQGPPQGGPPPSFRPPEGQ